VKSFKLGVTFIIVWALFLSTNFISAAIYTINLDKWNSKIGPFWTSFFEIGSFLLISSSLFLLAGIYLILKDKKSVR